MADGSNNSLGVRLGRTRDSSRAVAAVTNLAEPSDGVLLAEPGPLALMHQRCRLTTTLSTKGNQTDCYRLDRVELAGRKASLTARAVLPSRQSRPTPLGRLVRLLAIRGRTHAAGLIHPVGTLGVFLRRHAARSLSHQTAKPPRRNNRIPRETSHYTFVHPKGFGRRHEADYRRFSKSRQDRSAGEGAITWGKQDTASGALAASVWRLGVR